MLSDINLKGIVGEVAVKQILIELKKEMLLYFIENFKYVRNKTLVQCDFVIFTKKGLFSIEVKNWGCVVHCKPDYYWDIEYYSRGREVQKNVVRSPVFQNSWHASFLSDITGRDYESLVVFTNNAKLIDNPANVILASQLKDKLRSLPDVLDDRTVYVEAVRLAELSREFKTGSRGVKFDASGSDVSDM